MTAACWLQSPLPAGHRTEKGGARPIRRLCVPTDGRFSRLENRQKAQSRGRSWESPGSRREGNLDKREPRPISLRRLVGASSRRELARGRLVSLAPECARLLIGWMDQHQRNSPSSVPCRSPSGLLPARRKPPSLYRLPESWCYSRRDKLTNQDALGKTGDRASCVRNTTRFAEHIDNCPPPLRNSRGKGRLLPLTEGSEGGDLVTCSGLPLSRWKWVAITSVTRSLGGGQSRYRHCVCQWSPSYTVAM